jgi:hypothetical protein
MDTFVAAQKQALKPGAAEFEKKYLATIDNAITKWGIQLNHTCMLWLTKFEIQLLQVGFLRETPTEHTFCPTTFTTSSRPPQLGHRV